MKQLLLVLFGITAGPIILAFAVASVFDIETYRVLYYEGFFAFWISWYGVYYGLVDDSWNTDKKLIYFGVLTLGWLLMEVSGETLFPRMAD